MMSTGNKRQLQRSVRVITGMRKNEPIFLRILEAIGPDINARSHWNAVTLSQPTRKQNDPAAHPPDG
jgi:hypothetical protein